MEIMFEESEKMRVEILQKKFSEYFLIFVCNFLFYVVSWFSGQVLIQEHVMFVYFTPLLHWKVKHDFTVI